MQRKGFFTIPFLFLLGVLLLSNSSRGVEPPIKDFVVVLDAGHGGHDPGNLGNGYLEKNIALGIVLQAGQILEQYEGIKVIYTRKDDTFVDLYVRGEIANKANADLFVSVHCDSHTSDAQGAGTFVLGLHANKQNFEIAKKENSVIYLEDNYETRYKDYDINSPESVIGLTIMQEEFLHQSIQLATFMQDNFSKMLRRNDRKVKQAGFIVLHQTFMPSVLVETGFLTNKSEGMYLNSQRGQVEMGKAIAEAIIKYKNGAPSGFESEKKTAPEVSNNTPVKKQGPPEKPKVVEEAPKEVVSTETPKVDPQPTEKKEETVDLSEKTTASAEEPKKEQQATLAKETKAPQEVQPNTEATADTAKASEPLQKAEEPTPKKPEEVQTPPAKQAEKTEAVVKNQPSEKKTLEPGVVISFKVQLLASSKNLPLQAEKFNGLTELSKEPYKSLYRYFYGSTTSYVKAKLLKANADAKGYNTSFIVAYRDGARIPIEEALKYVSE